jgi:MarR family transcriptional regulator, 2-MHQ and catechol-resistance regulon repressor
MKKRKIDLSVRQEAILRAFVEMGRSFMGIRNAEAKEFEALGLTVGQFSVLEVLTHQGEQSIGAVTKLLFSTPGNVTVLIKNLESKGLIVTFCDPNDKRSKMARVTSNGEQIINSMWLDHKELLESFFVRLEDEEVANLARLLRKMRKEVKNESKKIA